MGKSSDFCSYDFYVVSVGLNMVNHHMVRISVGFYGLRPQNPPRFGEETLMRASLSAQISLLPPANEVCRKVMFLQASLIPSVYRMVGGGGWLPRMHHRSHDQRRYVYREVCIQGGLHREVGGGGERPHPSRALQDTVNKRRYASYWNAFLFSCSF